MPLGGYVKLAGETVAGRDRTGAPDEFLSKSKWVRFQVYLAGPVMNILLAWIVLGGVLTHGADVPSLSDRAAASSAPSTADSPAARRPACSPAIASSSINGRRRPTWDALDMAVLPKANRELTLVVERAGQPLTIPITPQATGRTRSATIGIAAACMRPQVVQVHPNTPAARAGLQRGDVLLAVDGARDLDQPAIIKRIRESAGKPIVFTVERDGAAGRRAVTPEGSVGLGARSASRLSPFEVRRVDLGIIDAFKLSAEQNWENAKLIGATLRDLVTRETPVKQLMGPIAIASSPAAPRSSAGSRCSS